MPPGAEHKSKRKRKSDTHDSNADPHVAKKIKSKKSTKSRPRTGRDGHADPLRPPQSTTQAGASVSETLDEPAMPVEQPTAPQEAHDETRDSLHATPTDTPIAAQASPRAPPQAHTTIASGATTESHVQTRAQNGLQNGLHGGLESAQRDLIPPSDALPNLHGQSWPWLKSTPIGGLLQSQDPIFTHDEANVILATPDTISVYSIADSLLVRSFSIASPSRPVQLRLSPVRPEILIVALADGHIQSWDWQTGALKHSVKLNHHIIDFDVVPDPTASADLLYTLVHTKPEPNSADPLDPYFVFELNLTRTSPFPLWGSRDHLTAIRAVAGGTALFVISSSSLSVASLVKNAASSRMRYSWSTLDFPAGISSFDVQVTPSPAGSPSPGTFDVAIGAMNGVIRVCSDIISKVTAHAPLQSQQQHWHRGPVLCLKWSRDGQYLISGGQESVLILWNLSTGLNQTLPHLAGAIQALAISPSGTEYGVRLADNAVMVLSTSELAPKAVISSVQSSIAGMDKGYLGRVLVPATTHSKQPNCLLLAVPTAQLASLENQRDSVPFLQTFDIATRRHVSRQALARNNVTTVVVKSRHQICKEASVTHMQTSCDGEWLATVDNWKPPEANLGFVDNGNLALLLEARQRRESYLKFWRWDQTVGTWILEGRFDKPHQSEDSIVDNKILDLASSPDKAGFATVGEDGVVRIWIPKTRLKDGRVIRGVHAQGITTWACHRHIDVAMPKSSSFDRAASLAYSADGSVLCVAFRDSGGWVQFLNPAEGTISTSQPAMFESFLRGMQFCHRYLIILADEVRVWDVVDNRLQFSYNLGQFQAAQSSHLCVNPDEATFAVSFSKPSYEERATHWSHYVAVFDPTSAQPLLLEQVPNYTANIIAMKAPYGFALVDNVAQIRTLSSKTATVSELGHGLAREPEVPTADAADTDDEAEASAEEVPVEAQDDDDSDGGEDRVVAAHELAEVFQGKQSYALPPVQDLFGAVASLYMGKSSKKQQSAGKRKVKA